MHYPYFDTSTIVLYSIVGTICMLSIHIAKSSRHYKYKQTIFGLSMMIGILVLFAALRKVGLHLGGEDSQRYEEAFVNFYNHGADRYEDTDILFGYLTGTLRFITDSAIVYRICCYGIIAFGYAFFIRYICPNGVSSIPFICILFPFMRSLNTMRSSIAMSLFLICLVCLYKRKTMWCIIWASAAILMHRLTFVMLSFFPFYLLFKDYITKASRTKFVLFTVTFILLSYIVAVQLQKYIMLMSLFEDNGNADLWYLTNKQGANILLNWPMYIVHILLFTCIVIFYNKLPNSKEVAFLKIIFVFDIIILPASLVLGMYRFAEYLYVPNLILWAMLIETISHLLTKNSSYIVKGCFLVGFYGLMIIRLTREWEDAALMPYIFIWS